MRLYDDVARSDGNNNEMLKKILKIGAFALAAAFIIIQFFQIDRSNVPVVPGQDISSIINVPADVSQIMVRSCSDCHTNSTAYPWYSYIQPVGWFLKDHIDDGKRHFNLSTFATYDAKKQKKKLEEVCDEVSSGNMPLPSYLWIHRDAVLTESEKATLCDWTKSATQ